MLLSAAAAARTPAYDDWLNDLSLMPPVSVTMQARNLPPPAAAPELDDGDAAAGVVLLELEDDPQAAATRAITANPAANFICALNSYLLRPGALQVPGRTPAPSPAPAGWG